VAIIAGGRVVADGAPAALILAHLAPEAVELDCTPEEEQALCDGTRPRARGRVGRRAILYTEGGAALVAHPRRRDPGERRALAARRPSVGGVSLALTGTCRGGAWVSPCRPRSPSGGGRPPCTAAPGGSTSCRTSSSRSSTWSRSASAWGRT